MKQETMLARVGRPAKHGPVNVAVQHASTITFPSVDAFDRARHRVYETQDLYYGLFGTQTAFALEDAMAQLEGGYRSVALPSGLAAITVTFFAFASAGSHVLVPDSVYGPVREFCDTILRDAGVETTYYDPLIGGAIVDLMRANTALVYLESPGSLTFEVQDAPAIVAAAAARSIPTAIDNTWATPLFFSAFDHGIDVSIHAATKYIGGHSDVVCGIVTTNERVHKRIRECSGRLGFSIAPDDCYLALRGLRTLGVRLKRHESSALVIARALREHPRVRTVLHPGLEGAPGHDLWKRDFRGSAGLFAFVLRAGYREASAFIESLELFAIGASWGGFESLAIVARPPRSATRTPHDKQTEALVRLQIGLEDPGDLLADLERALG